MRRCRCGGDGGSVSVVLINYIMLRLLVSVLLVNSGLRSRQLWDDANDCIGVVYRYWWLCVPWLQIAACFGVCVGVGGLGFVNLCVIDLGVVDLCVRRP